MSTELVNIHGQKKTDGDTIYVIQMFKKTAVPLTGKIIGKGTKKHFFANIGGELIWFDRDTLISDQHRLEVVEEPFTYELNAHLHQLVESTDRLGAASRRLWSEKPPFKEFSKEAQHFQDLAEKTMRLALLYRANIEMFHLGNSAQ